MRSPQKKAIWLREVDNGYMDIMDGDRRVATTDSLYSVDYFLARYLKPLNRKLSNETLKFFGEIP